MPRIVATVDGHRAPLQINRPKFADLWAKYPVKSEATDVYKSVGGNVYELYKGNPSGYENACALRLSKAFNYGGVTITTGATGYKVKGADGKPYLLRVNDMIKFVRANFGASDLVTRPKGQDTSSQFMGKKGIIIFKVTGWGNATGHVTLWNGSDCGDHCYFVHPFLFGAEPKTTEIYFWELK